MLKSRAAQGAIILLATLVGAAGTARLGFWQLQRAAQKTELRAEMEQRRQLAAVGNLELAGTPAAAELQHYRPARLRGRWATEATIYLENRQNKGRPGFFVVTPLRLEGRSEAVAVQRGWVQRNFEERTALPPLRTPPGPVEVEGIIAPPPSRLYDFSPAASGPIRQNLDLAAYARESHLPLLPLSVLQSASPSTSGDGLLRDWPVPTLDVDHHYGYALQWFSLSALIVGLYVWFRFLRPAFFRKP